jgi:hypothetical protein
MHLILVPTGYELQSLLMPGAGILQKNPYGAGSGTNYGYARRLLHHSPNFAASTQVEWSTIPLRDPHCGARHALWLGLLMHKQDDAGGKDSDRAKDREEGP